MKTQRNADVVSGLFLVVLGILVIIAASQIRGGMEERLPPRTLPYTVGAMILIGGGILALKSWKFGKEGLPISWPDRLATIRIAVFLMAAVAFILLITPLGFSLSSALYIIFSIWYLKRSAIWTALIVGVSAGLLSYYVFGELLGLSLPMGTLFFD
ncbi:MAG: tripartite tricarboxylate transporter TctB family protein [Syntrophobacteraceae bacterium]